VSPRSVAHPSSGQKIEQLPRRLATSPTKPAPDRVDEGRKRRIERRGVPGRIASVGRTFCSNNLRRAISVSRVVSRPQSIITSNKVHSVHRRMRSSAGDWTRPPTLVQRDDLTVNDRVGGTLRALNRRPSFSGRPSVGRASSSTHSHGGKRISTKAADQRDGTGENSDDYQHVQG
jgi:hypothetical protein